MENKRKETHFGNRSVLLGDKQKLINQVFDSVTYKYDLMNDIMSFGIHRAWKWFAVHQSGVQRGDKVLDVAAGTASLAHKFSNKVGCQGQVVVTDINQKMLVHGRNRMIDRGIINNVRYAVANAEQLPFPNNHFDCIACAFGLRNVPQPKRALHSIYHCLKSGGRALILEFSKPVYQPLKKVYDSYSFHVIPWLGQYITQDRESYQYLVESIRQHPDQEEQKQWMLEAGFDDVRYYNLSGGIVALHIGFKA